MADDAMFPEHETTLTSGPHQLAATVVRSSADADGPKPGILFLHGLGSDRSGYVIRARRAARELGATCLAVDLSGHGESSGDLPAISPRQHLGDALAAYDALAGQDGVDDARVGVCGASYGGFLAAMLTGQRGVARLLVRAPTIVADRFLDRPLREREKDRSPASATQWSAALGLYRRPVLVVECGRDAVIPRDVIEAYVAAAPDAQHVLMAQAGHALVRPAWQQEFERIMIDFFRAL